MGAYEELVDKLDGECDIVLATGDGRDGSRFARVFFYDGDESTGEYLDFSEDAGTGLLDSNCFYNYEPDDDEPKVSGMDADGAFELYEAYVDGCFNGGVAGDYRDYWIGEVDFEEKPEYMQRWYWRDDIEDVSDLGPYSEHPAADYDPDELYRMAGERIVADEHEGEDLDEYSSEYDDMVAEASGDIIHLWTVAKSSNLYECLNEWFEGQGKKLAEEARDFFELDRAVFFVTGTGYSIMSADLLGGSSDGRAEREFDGFADRWWDARSEKIRKTARKY